MNSVVAVKKEVEELKQQIFPEGNTRYILHLWMPSDDPKHKMTDDEIIAQGYREHKRIITVPLRENQHEMTNEEIIAQDKKEHKKITIFP
jgi:hypothetical protein